MVASDLFTLGGHDYVIVTVYFSKFVEKERLPDKSSATVVNKIKKIFSRHGIPKELCTDNGPEYSAACFKCFTKEWAHHFKSTFLLIQRFCRKSHSDREEVPIEGTTG